MGFRQGMSNPGLSTDLYSDKEKRKLEERIRLKEQRAAQGQYDQYSKLSPQEQHDRYLAKNKSKEMRKSESAVKVKKAESAGKSQDKDSSGGSNVGAYIQAGQSLMDMTKSSSGGSGEPDLSGTSTGESVGEGSLQGAATGASIGTAISPGVGTAIGAGVGAVIGGTLGAIKARSKRKQAQAQIEAKKQEELGRIEGEKGDRIQRAMAGLGQAFSRNLSRRLQVRL
jgi:hypothetical protein